MAAWVTGKRRQQGTSARGLGWEHQQRRKHWASKVKTGHVRCHICGYMITPGQPWHLDHLIPTSLGGALDGARHPAHRGCNIRKGGRNKISAWSR